MPCILWITCDCPSDELISTIGIQPYKIIEKGSVLNTAGGEKYYEQTVCGFDVSKETFVDFKAIVLESIQWLLKHYDELQKLGSLTATARLEFGYYTQFVDSKIVAQYDTIPYALIKLAADLRLEIELSQYWYSDEQGAQLN
jgi:hypothetical protein